MFSRFRTLISCALLGSLLATPTLADRRTVVAPSDGSAAIYQMGWGGGGGGNMVVIWRPSLQPDGRVAICGIWVLTNAMMRRGAEQVLRRATVRVDGQVAKRGLGAFNRSPTIEALDTTAPACVMTDARGPWKEVAVTFGNGSFSN